MNIINKTSRKLKITLLSQNINQVDPDVGSVDLKPQETFDDNDFKPDSIEIEEIK